MKLSLNGNDFLDAFDKLDELHLDEHGKYKLNLFSLKVNSNEFDIKYLEEKLIDPLIDYSLSRNAKEEHKNKSATLSRKAREKFRNYISNKGELGELILYCFLESHLNAPKILSKLELKTSTSLYVNGADGVHFLKLANGNFQLIFGESKTVEDITDAIRDALESSRNFKFEKNKDGDKKSGIGYEKSLISDHLDKETFTLDEKEFLKAVIYPQRDSTFEVDDAFGVFIAYEISITDEDKELPNDQFRLKIKKQIKDEVNNRKKYILTKLKEFNLTGHNFYLYVMPLTELQKNREKLTKKITE